MAVTTTRVRSRWFATLFTAIAAATAYQPVLMPNQTLCDQDLHVDGAVIEASHYESTDKYFSCRIIFKRTNSSAQSPDQRWVLRIDRMFIPYHKGEVSGTFPSIDIVTSYNGTISLKHPVNTSLLKKDILTQSLSLSFVNLPRSSDYKLVVTMDSGDVNCTGGHKCATSDYCIGSSLKCDAVDNCGDNSDEDIVLCPEPAQTTSIIVIAGGSVTVIVIGALVVLTVVCCRSKMKREKRRVARCVTYIRAPKAESAKQESPTSTAVRARPTGPGYQPAPLAFRNSFGSSTGINGGSLPRLAALKASGGSLPRTEALKYQEALPLPGSRKQSLAVPQAAEFAASTPSAEERSLLSPSQSDVRFSRRLSDLSPSCSRAGKADVSCSVTAPQFEPAAVDATAPPANPKDLTRRLPAGEEFQLSLAEGRVPPASVVHGTATDVVHSGS